MKNVIVLLIDSVYSGCLGDRKTEISSTPFIDTLKDSAIFAPNVYSYGPYTDAASKALYCGNRTLDDYGYFFGLNSSEYNHFRLFHENGYETFGLYYPYYLLGSKIEKYIDHSIYTSGFKYVSVWGGKFEYYANIQKERALTELEYALLIKCMEVVFDSWSLFYDNIENTGCSDIVNTIFNSSLQGTGKSGLDLEIEKFRSNPVSYIDGVLSLGMDHPLAKINEYDYGREEDFAFVNEIYEKNASFFKALATTNAFKNIINNPISLKKSASNLCKYLKSGDKTELRYFGNYGMLLCHTGLMKKRSLKPKWQDLASLNKQIEVLLANLDKRPEDSDKPFYASIHALEPHHNISFFSFDSFDHKLVKEELDYIKPLIKGCGKKFAGNLLYQLSLRYVDLCVKKLYNELKKRDLLENTAVMLVSDHGTSYSFDPVRTRVVNTFHKENYNIPLLIWDKDLSAKAATYDGMYCSDDVFPTLCDVVGIETPTCFTGTSIMKNTVGREYVITEYMGPGVPDMLQKDVWMSIRNEKYVIAYKKPLNKPFKAYKPVIVYNLDLDPQETRDVSGAFCENIGKDQLQLLTIIEDRCTKIKEQCETFLKRIKEYEDFEL